MRLIKQIFKKEIQSYFNSPVAYVVLAIFTLTASALYYFIIGGGLFASEIASMRSLFALMPWLLMVLAPALTMRLFAEERKTGTMEVLMTLPVTEWQVVLGKFYAGWFVVAAGILLTAPLAFLLTLIVPEGFSIDFGPIIGSYLGAIFLSGVFVALGVLMSALTKNQIVAFITALAGAFVLIILDGVANVFPDVIGQFVQYLSVNYHFDGISRGVLDSRNILYYVSLIVLFLYLTKTVLTNERADKVREASLFAGTTQKLDRTLFVSTMCASVILVNLLAADYFFRIDMTRDGVYTLSDATEKALQDLEDPIEVTAYFSKDLPPQLEMARRLTKDMLEEYRTASNGMFSYVFLDPAAEETDEDKKIKREVQTDIFGRRIREQTQLENELAALGIQPVEVTIVKDDMKQQKRAYLGLALRHGDATEAIPVIQSVETFEYDLTTMIRKLTRPKVPVLGILQGAGTPVLAERLTRFKTLVEQNYAIKAIEIPAEGAFSIEDDVDALVVAGVKETLSKEVLEKIDQFVVSGHSVTFMVDLVNADLKQFNPTPVSTGLNTMLESYGVTLGDKIIADTQAALMSMPTKTRFGQMMQRVPYPMIPELGFVSSEHPLVKGVQQLVVPFTTTVSSNRQDGLIFEQVAETSAKSWLVEPTLDKLRPDQQYKGQDIKFDGPHTFMATVTGQFKSHFDSSKQAKTETRVAVIGSGSILMDDFLSGGNAALLLNLTDWMLLDTGLLDMRSRTFSEAPIDPELSSSTKSFVKYGGLMVAPLLLVIFGLSRRGRRRVMRRVYEEAMK